MSRAQPEGAVVLGRGTRPPLLLQTFLMLVLVASVTGLIALGGGLRTVVSAPILADLTIQEFDMPAAFSVEPETVAGELARRLQDRAERDPALRAILGGEAQAQLQEVVIPRLLNATVLRSMIEEMDSLGTVIAVSDFGGLVTGTVENAVATELEDVALTMPGALRAETSSGLPLEIDTPEDGVAAIRFGSIEAQGAVAFRVWLNDAPASVEAFGDMVRVGAAGGLDGRVALHGQADWVGAALETRPWVRWLITGLVAFVAVAAFLALAASVRHTWRSRRA